jgi:hypothetical protein
MDRDIRILSLAALAATILATVQATAQTPPRTKPPIAPKSEQLDLNGCSSDRATIGQGGAIDTRKPDGRDLSERLASSGGVICPPSQVDPAIKAPTPEGGSMPVIPPPGSPGGNPNIAPK